MMTDEELAAIEVRAQIRDWSTEGDLDILALVAEVRRLKEECAQVSISYDIDVADLPLTAMMENRAVPMARVRIVAKMADGWHGCEPPCPVRMVHADTEEQVLHMLDSASVTGP